MPSEDQLETSPRARASVPEREMERLWWAVAPGADALIRAGQSNAWGDWMRLVEAMGDGVSVEDLEGRCLYLNPASASLRGGTVAELIGRARREPMGAPAPIPGAREALVLSEAFPPNAPAGWRLVEVRGPYRDATGTHLGWVTVSRALPNETTAELSARIASLESELRARDELLAVASHELSSPLGALRLQIEVFLRATRQKRTEPAPSWVVERVGAVEKSVKRLGRQVATLLDFSQAQAGKLVPCIEQMDLCATAKEVITRYADEVVEAGCSLKFDAPSAVIGEWDPVRIEQVITNLLVNALKFGRAGPITLALEEREGTALLHVSDRGPGIPETEHERIFHLFERGTRERRIPGFGLGLAIAKAIVEAHHGRISVKSAPGRGATFTVELPRTQPGPHPDGA